MRYTGHRSHTERLVRRARRAGLCYVYMPRCFSRYLLDNNVERMLRAGEPLRLQVNDQKCVIVLVTERLKAAR